MSEFRKDLVSGEWIIIAPERAKRPHDLLPRRAARKAPPKSKCPFEDLERSGNGPILAATPDAHRWEAVIIPNKYPALRHAATCALRGKEGPHEFMSGTGEHDLLLTRDHATTFADLPLVKAVAALRLLQEHYRTIGRDRCLTYVSSFYNHGASAGASIYHPHFQVVGLPIIPPDICHSLEGSQRYFAVRRTCVHCALIRYERKRKRGVIETNHGAITITPYASRQPFEVRIYPLRHNPRFEDASVRDLTAVTAFLQSALRKVRRRLNDPDLNFFVHTAPLHPPRAYAHYHWHIEIVPKISVPAGFELSTGILINVVDPDVAAKILRGKK